MLLSLIKDFGPLSVLPHSSQLRTPFTAATEASFRGIPLFPPDFPLFSKAAMVYFRLLRLNYGWRHLLLVPAATTPSPKSSRSFPIRHCTISDHRHYFLSACIPGVTVFRCGCLFENCGRLRPSSAQEWPRLDTPDVLSGQPDRKSVV